MTKIKPALPIVIVLLLLAGGAYLYYHYYAPSGSEALEASGTIEATAVELTARASGIVTGFHISEGDRVSSNQLVAELSRADLVAQAQRDALAVKEAEAKLNDLTAGARSQEIEQAAINVKMIQDKLDQANQDLGRASSLLDSGAVSRQDWEQLQLSRDTLESQLKSAQSSLSLLQAGSRPDAINAARAEVDRSRAVLKASQSLLNDLKIYAPRGGTIVSKNYEQGEYVSPGASLATLADLNDLWIKVYIPTDQLPRVRLKQAVTVSVSGSRRAFNGKVIEIASQGEYTPKTIQTKEERANVVYAVKIDVANQKSVLKPGMPADVIFVDGDH